MPTRRTFILVIATCTGLTALLPAVKLQSVGSEVEVRPRPAYHLHLPGTPLPSTLDPGQFKDNHAAFVAYILAAEVKETLYQVPCYCGCDRNRGHESLLDCFTSTHGERCSICEKEVVFCFIQHKKGKNSAQIRKQLANGKALQIDLTTEVQTLDREIQNRKD